MKAFNCLQKMTDVKLLALNNNTWKHLTVYKKMNDVKLNY